jgi:hypothetical protein
MIKLSFRILLSIFFIVSFFSCGQMVTYERYVPEYLTYQELRSSVEVKTSGLPAIENPGKIYLMDDFLIIGERNLGIHIVDISDVSTPQAIAFIEIPGNTDISILQKNNETLLYADSFIDLVVFELNLDANNFTASETNRVEEVFPNDPYQFFMDDISVPWFEDLDTDQQVVVGYSVETYSEWTTFGEKVYVDYADTSSAGGTSGTAGSMARFVLYGDLSDHWYLYSIDNWNLRTFDLETPSEPLPDSTKEIGWNIETLGICQDSFRHGYVIYRFFLGYVHL